MNQKDIPATYALVGGTNAWKSAGYPMEGSGPSSGLTTAPQQAPAQIAEPIAPYAEGAKGSEKDKTEEKKK